MFLNFFTKADKGLDIALRWIGAFTLLSAASSWLAKNMTWLGNLNWADAIVVGIGMACAITLVLSFALIAVRQFRPPPDNSALPPPALDYPSANGAQTSDLNEVLVKIENLEVQVKSSHETLREQSKEASRLDRKVELVTKLANTHSEQTSEMFELLRKSDEDLQNEIKELRHPQELMAKKIEEIDQRISEAFAALYTRETLTLFEDLIEADAAALYDRLKAGEAYTREEWDEWEKQHREWRTLVGRWIDSGQFYYARLGKQVLEVTDSQYRSNWTVSDDQFPDAEAVRVFKQHRIQHSNWLEAREQVEKNLKQVAYVGMKQQEVRNYS